MNILDVDARSRILDLASDGATIREIAADVGCHKGTVRSTLARIVDERRRLAELAMDLLQKASPELENGLIEMHATLAFSCPIHPDAIESDFSDDGSGCRLCTDSERKRRKAEGRPIVPPRRARSVPPQGTMDGPPPSNAPSLPPGLILA